ncbi:MAG TPA: capsule biosynthesis GfcC family protein [Stenotrophomonas sp.]|jgi:hypothetical protein
MRPLLLALLTCVVFDASALPAPVRVEVVGEVKRPGVLQLPVGSRFADAVLVAMPTTNAYPLGAAMLRSSEMPEQKRRKAGVEYDLVAVANHPDTTPAMAMQAKKLHQWLQSLPVTGRIRAQLDPRRLEVDGSNRLLADSDFFVYPRRPTTIQVVGAVLHPCNLRHVPLQDAVDYLRQCEVDSAAVDRNSLFVVQPDGVIQVLGSALWNRSPSVALAPGAILYVPLDEAALSRVAPRLNHDLAEFLATQFLSADLP